MYKNQKWFYPFGHRELEPVVYYDWRYERGHPVEAVNPHYRDTFWCRSCKMQGSAKTLSNYPCHD